jgi:enoyl-CoA hydratase/carnithine racemase
VSSLRPEMPSSAQERSARWVSSVVTRHDGVMAEETAAPQELTYQVVDHVATITFNCPERMNTISGPMLDQLTELLLVADRDRDVRVIVLTGTGRAFCAGLDIKAQASGTGLLQSTGGPQELDLRSTPPTVLHNLDTPVIAALNGSAAGYGLDIALGADIRIAARSAKLAVAFTKRGIVPESGGTWLLPRIVGRAKAAELIFTGRTLLAEEAAEIGLVNKVVDDDALGKEVATLAAEIASNAPLAVRAAKRMMRAADDETFDQNVHHVFLQLLPLFRTNDFREAMTAFVERRPANFEGR